MSPVSILVIAVVLLLFIIIVIYNQLVKKRILVKEAWSGIGTFLQQRNDMIPNLVETVKGYALHESSTLADIVKWRNKGASASNPTEQMDAGDHLNQSLMDFFALAEAYPDLKANSNFMSLQADLKEMETRINQSRRYYNGTVRSYNQAIAVFPSNILAGIFGFTAEPFFEEEATARNLPGVSFK